MNSLPQLPASPFFCAQDGGYLPELTDAIVDAAARQQEAEILEELLKLRLRGGRDVTFPAGGSDQGRLDGSGLLVGVPAYADLGARRSPDFIFPGGLVDDGFKFKSDTSSATTPSVRRPTTAANETVTTTRHHQPASAAVRPPIEAEAPRLSSPAQHNAFPNGRWAKGRWSL